MAAGANATELAGRVLILGGAVAVLVGLVLLFAARFGWHWRPLPGDIVIRRPGVVVSFPIVTMLLISLVVTLIAHLIRYLQR